MKAYSSKFGWPLRGWTVFVFVCFCWVNIGQMGYEEHSDTLFQQNCSVTLITNVEILWRPTSHCATPPRVSQIHLPATGWPGRGHQWNVWYNLIQIEQIISIISIIPYGLYWCKHMQVASQKDPVDPCRAYFWGSSTFSGGVVWCDLTDGMFIV